MLGTVQKKVPQLLKMTENGRIPSVAIIGSSYAGKTACLKSFLYDSYTDEYHPTILDDYVKSVVHISESYEVHIWDTPGDVLYRSVLKSVVKHVDAIAVLYSVDSKESFSNAANIVEIQDQLNIPIVLIGNKLDLSKEKWKVSQKDVSSLFGKTKSISETFQCSAKTGKNVSETFNAVCNLAIEHWKTNSTKFVKKMEKMDLCILS